MHPRTREILQYLDQQRSILHAAFDAVPVTLCECSPGPDRWSAAGVIEHLALVESRVAGRLSTRIARAREEGIGPELSTDPVLPTVNISHLLDRTTRFSASVEVQPTGLNAESAWVALERAGAAVREAVRAGDNLALGTVFMPHPRFGQMPVYYFFAFVGAHEARHAAQIREIVERFAETERQKILKRWTSA